MPRPAADPCPCGSAQPYAACCGPCHSGARPAATAEALMRARYSAFVRRDAAFLLATWHPSTRPPVLDFAGDRTQWLGLKVLAARGGPHDAEGVVEFVARSRLGGRAQRLHEQSRFVRLHGAWVYLDGEFPERAQKEGRDAGPGQTTKGG